MTPPSHYTYGNRETISIIEDVLSDHNFTAYEGYLIGNVVKYLCRHKHKGGAEDLKKAQKYLEFLIKNKEDSGGGEKR